MKPESMEMQVERVENGWVVRPFNLQQARLGYSFSDVFVARTPSELAQLLMDWAVSQEKK